MPRMVGLRSASPQPSIHSIQDGSPGAGMSKVNMASNFASAVGARSNSSSRRAMSCSAAKRNASASRISLESKW